MSWKTLEAYKKISDKIKVTVVKGNINNPVQGDPWEIKVTGVIGDMSSSTTLKSLEKLINNLSTKVEEGFESVNSRLDNVEKRLDNVEKRLDNVEKDIKDIKECPTIQKELKELKK